MKVLQTEKQKQNEKKVNNEKEAAPFSFRFVLGINVVLKKTRHCTGLWSLLWQDARMEPLERQMEYLSSREYPIDECQLPGPMMVN